MPVSVRTTLDKREREVAAGVARDLPNKAIGPMGHVKDTLRIIFAKLGIQSRVRLAQLAIPLLLEDSSGPIRNT